MTEGWYEELPDPVDVPLAEVGEVITELERLLLQARADDYTDLAQSLDEVVGRMTRWVWPLLDELDDEDGRDE